VVIQCARLRDLTKAYREEDSSAFSLAAQISIGCNCRFLIGYVGCSERVAVLPGAITTFLPHAQFERRFALWLRWRLLAFPSFCSRLRYSLQNRAPFADPITAWVFPERRRYFCCGLVVDCVLLSTSETLNFCKLWRATFGSATLPSSCWWLYFSARCLSAVAFFFFFGGGGDAELELQNLFPTPQLVPGMPKRGRNV